MSSAAPAAEALQLVDSRQAAVRLVAALGIMTVGACAMYVVPVVLPQVQSDFGVSRADASLPYSVLMIAYGIGGLAMGKLADRHGVMVPLILSACGIALGYWAAATGTSIAGFTIAHALLGAACSTTFAPLLADTALWFVRRRGIAVAVCASGNYVGGAIWPPVAQRMVEAMGWRQTYMTLAILCGVSVALLAFVMRRRAPVLAAANASQAPHPSGKPFGLPRGAPLALLCVAGVACCTAMSMPQVHIVAYCGDLGYGVARGAEMLAVMMGFGIVSRLVSGVICDRIGGLRTLLLGSALQGVALLLFLPFDGLVSLYAISALFGLFQGGIVPSYAIIVREHFPAQETGAKVGACIMFTLLGMALGGWMSGKIFDLTGSYQAAFVNGLAWNALNLGIVYFLLRRSRR
jgi:MFS family permease